MDSSSRLPGGKVAGRVTPLAGLLILTAVIALGYAAINSFNSSVEPELDNRSRLIGTIIRSNIERALDLGVPIDEMAGTDAYLIDVLGSFPEVARILIRSQDGRAVAGAERKPDGTVASIAVISLGGDGTSPDDGFRFVLLADNSVAGEIIIEADRAFVEQQFTDVFLDVAVIVLVALLLGFEIMLAAISTSLGKPLDGLYTGLRFPRWCHACRVRGSLRGRSRGSPHVCVGTGVSK